MLGVERQVGDKMATYNRRNQYKTEDAAQKYDKGQEEKYDAGQLRDADSLKPPKFFDEKEKQEYDEKRVEQVKVRSRAMLPRAEEEPIESLQRVSPQIIGGLFDRLQFLEQRITELQDAMKTRNELNKQMIAEIDKDVDEKNAMIRSISDMDEKRNLKLDISVLRREKRREYVQFWRDLLELRTELRELMEEHQMESKIAAMFKEMQGETPPTKR